MDNIPNEIELGVGEKSWKCLTLFLNLIIRQGETPYQWCDEKIKLLHKGGGGGGGGGEKDDLDNYRMIAIMSNVGKVLKAK